MKKTYIIPAIYVANVTKNNILAGSILINTDSTTEQLVKEQDGNDTWSSIW